MVLYVYCVFTNVNRFCLRSKYLCEHENLEHFNLSILTHYFVLDQFLNSDLKFDTKQNADEKLMG